MKHSSFFLSGLGLVVGLFIGSMVGGYGAQKPASLKSGNHPPAQPHDRDEARASKEERRHAGPNDTLAQLQAELEEARERAKLLERAASRLEWLRKNGMQTDGIAFDESTFTPKQHLIEFMGLTEMESNQLRTTTDAAKQAVLDWEVVNAQCIEDTPTNCVYELPPLPAEIKERFLQELATLFDPDDMETMKPIIDILYEGLENKRTASVTYVSKEEYLNRIAPQHRSNTTLHSDKLELKIQRYDESGNLRGSSSSILNIDSVHTGHGMPHRWAHLFSYGGESG